MNVHMNAGVTPRGREMLISRLQRGERRVVERPHLHVRGVGGVADVDGVEQETGGDVPGRQLVPHPAQPAGAEAREINAVVAGIAEAIVTRFGGLMLARGQGWPANQTERQRMH